jgi:hypothetical protein
MLYQNALFIYGISNVFFISKHIGYISLADSDDVFTYPHLLYNKNYCELSYILYLNIYETLTILLGITNFIVSKKLLQFYDLTISTRPSTINSSI